MTANWLFWFGLLFVAFIVFSPTGLVGVAERLLKPFRKKVVGDAAMSERKAGQVTLPDFMKPVDAGDGTILTATGLAKSFGGIKAVEGVDITMRDRRLHALIGRTARARPPPST